MLHCKLKSMGNFFYLLTLFLPESEQADHNRYYYFMFLNLPFPQVHIVQDFVDMDSESTDFYQGQESNNLTKCRLNISKSC